MTLNFLPCDKNNICPQQPSNINQDVWVPLYTQHMKCLRVEFTIKLHILSSLEKDDIDTQIIHIIMYANIIICLMLLF